MGILKFTAAIVLFIASNAHADEALPIADATCTKFKTEAQNAKPASYAKAWFRGVNVDCAGKIVEYRTQAKENFLGATARHWQKTQNNWNSVICADKDNILAIQNGWQVTEKITYMNGQTMTFAALCTP